jgi:hypothetical protein
MELELIRSYFPCGTNGELYLNGERICFTIELPWLSNKPRLSCIPEGRYEIAKRFSEHHGWHMHVRDVPKRSLILIHAANDAEKELKGCIAPVSILKAEGKGLRSRIALNKLQSIVFDSLDKNESVFLTIKSTGNEID